MNKYWFIKESSFLSFRCFSSRFFRSLFLLNFKCWFYCAFPFSCWIS